MDEDCESKRRMPVRRGECVCMQVGRCIGDEGGGGRGRRREREEEKRQRTGACVDFPAYSCSESQLKLLSMYVAVICR